MSEFFHHSGGGQNPLIFPVPWIAPKSFNSCQGLCFATPGMMTFTQCNVKKLEHWVVYTLCCSFELTGSYYLKAILFANFSLASGK